MNRFSGDESGVYVLDQRSESGEGLDAFESDPTRVWLRKLRDLPPVRLAKVLRVRDEIARGTYETEERWRIAIDRLMEELG
jgi:hypothetical protein